MSGTGNWAGKSRTSDDVARWWQWTNTMAIATQLEPDQVLDRLARAWPSALASVPPPEPRSTSGTHALHGQYVTPQRAAVRLTLDGTLSADSQGRVVRLSVAAEPHGVAFFVFCGAAILLPVLALIFDALELRQAVLCWLAAVGLFGAAQWIVAGVTLGRLSRKVTDSLASPP